MKDDTKTTKTTVKDAQTERAKAAFAGQLKAARERTGKTQSQFFQLIKKGKSPGDAILTHDASSLKNNISYNQYEIAKNFPSLPELRRLAYHCNVSTDELLGMYDAKFFCRVIKKIYPDTSLTTTDLPLASGEWPNDKNCSLQIKVTSPEGKVYCPPLDKLETIRKNCWDSYQKDLARQIAFYLRGELFKERMLSEEFGFSNEQLAFLKMLSFLALNETLQKPIIERTQSATIAFNTFCNTLKSNSKMYEGCFQGSTDMAICFYLMTNINPASVGNRITALFKFYALKMYSRENFPRGISSAAFEQALSELSQEDSLLKRIFNDENDNLSYFKDSKPFNNEFYRFLISRIKSYINDGSTQNRKSVPDDSIDVDNVQYNLTIHVKTKKLFLGKLVREGRYWEKEEWKAFTDYRPAFFAGNVPETVEAIKNCLGIELFGAKPAKPKAKQPPGPIKPTSKDDGHGGY